MPPRQAEVVWSVSEKTGKSDLVALRPPPAEWQRGGMALFEPLSVPRRIADEAAASALFAGLAEEPVEVAAFAYLAHDRRLLGLRHMRSQLHDRLDLSIRTVATDALAFDAAALVMAHNHPNGDPSPSTADHEATRLLASTLRSLDVRLLDHLIVARGGIVSFRALGLL